MSMNVLNCKQELVTAKIEEGYELKTVCCTPVPPSHPCHAIGNRSWYYPKVFYVFSPERLASPRLIQSLYFFSESYVVGNN